MVFFHSRAPAFTWTPVQAGRLRHEIPRLQPVAPQATPICAIRDLGRYVTDLPFEREGISLASMSTVAEIKTAAGGLVVSNPGILGGTPVFRGTRLPVQTLFNYLADGLSLDYFLETFEGVTREQAQAVLRYGCERIAAEIVR